MLKNLFRIPDTFEPDDRRRRQVLNVSVMFMIFGANLGIVITFFIDAKTVLIPALFSTVFFSILWLMNRSNQIPSWLSGMIFMIAIIVLFSQVDTPTELYNGRSTIVWAISIVFSAIIFPSGYQFLVTLVIYLMMIFLTPPDPRYPTNSVNYFSMLDLFIITLISWVGQRISNQAIRDAHRHAANLEAVLNSITDGVLVLDMEGKLISANPALLKMISKEQLLQIITKPLEKKMRLERKFFVVTSAPVPEIGSVTVFHDETRRIETDRAKDALLATASHELRTPLTATMNYLEMIQTFIKMGKISTEEFTQYLDRAIENTYRLRQLINNILDQAQIQAGVLELKEKTFNLPVMFEKTRQLLDILLTQKNLSYSLQIASNVPNEIHTDPDRLHQVLVNLIGNAIKFTKQGGIHVKVFRQNHTDLAIEVTDTGAGIPDERLPDIFEAFRRGSDYAQREQQGAGLGLSIAREIVSRMGGEISVASALGVGSTFTVSIPIHP